MSDDEKHNDDTKLEYPVIPLVIPNNCNYDSESNKILIDPNKSRNELIIYKPGIDYIRNISCKIATISIVGRARTGKSLVAGELYAPKYIPCPFDLGHKMDACTYGIWVSAKPIKHPNEKDTVILIFDVEGTGFHQATKHNDMQLMVITLLISSYFIYNTKGTFTSAALDELEFVTELTDRIKVKPNDETGDGLENLLPNFMWLLRDVHLNPTIDDKIVSVKDYFTKKVLKYSKSKSAKNQHRQQIRRVFLETFRKYDAFTLPIPHSNTDTLQKLGVIERDKLEPQFNKQLDVFCEKVINEAKCKVLYVDNGQQGQNQFIHCTGTHVAGWIAECVKYVNDPHKIPEISSMTSIVMSNVFRSCKEKAILQYTQQLKEGLNKLRKNDNKQPLNINEIIDLHLNIWNCILTESGNCLQSTSLQQNMKDIDEQKNETNQINQQQTKIYNELCEEIGHNYLVSKIGETGILHDVLKENIFISHNFCNTFLNNYFDETIKPMLNKPEAYTADDLIFKFEDLHDIYYQICIYPERDDCWDKFYNENQMQSMEQFKKMKGFNERLLKEQKIAMEKERQTKELEEDNIRMKQQIEQQKLLHNQQVNRIQTRIEEQERENEARIQQQRKREDDMRKSGWVGHIACTALAVGIGYKTGNYMPALSCAINLIKFAFHAN